MIKAERSITLKQDICFCVADTFGLKITFDVERQLPYRQFAESVDKEKLAKTCCLSEMGYSAKDIKVITPEEYEERFGDDD